ncbi:MAG TPA: pilus assembly protein TadG-related protein [Gaiellaceae bacterium]|jgi:hypothetical protein
MLTLSRLLRWSRLDREEGQVLPLMAVAFIALIGMTGIVVDGGNLFQNKQSLQNAADAAAVAAALYLVNSNAPCVTVAGVKDQVASCAGEYALLNSANGPNGDSSDPSKCSGTWDPKDPCALQPCNTTSAASPLYVTDTQGPAQAPGCIVKNYPQPNQVEVWLTRNTTNYFGGIVGIGNSKESARAVGSLGPAPPPKINFASLFNGCDAHTLLIKAGGSLTVNQTIYANSCNSKHDAFDVKGSKFIKAPEIDVVGGWEITGSTSPGVYTTAPGQTWPQVTACPYLNSDSYYHNTGQNITSPGCPIDGVNPLSDPFALLPAPTQADGSPPPIALGAQALVTHKGRQSNIATLVTDPALPTFAGAKLQVANMDDLSFNTPGAQIISSNGDLVSYANTGSDVPSVGAVHAVSSGSIRNYIVTLTLSSGVQLCVGDAITVQNVDPIANGTFAVRTVNNPDLAGCNASATTITYTDTNARASTTYEKGGPAGTPSFGTETLASCGLASTCTATIDGLSTNASVHAGDEITVMNNTDEPTFDGSYTITADSVGSTVSYRPAPFVMTFDTNSITNGVATLNIGGPDDPPASLADGGPGAAKASILVTSDLPGSDPRFDGAQTVQSSNPGTDIVTYNLTSSSFNGWSVSGNQVTLNGTGNTGLKAGDKITVTFNNPAPPGCVKAGMPATVVSSSATQVVYSENNCTGSSGTNTGTIKIASAAGDDVSGTAQVLSTDATPTNGSLVVVPVDKTFAVGGTAGVVALTVPEGHGIATIIPAGTAASPKPYEVPSGTVTLHPGTYYGGICIGAGITNGAPNDCTGTNCNPTTSTAASVTMNPGVYWIAGGGFHVCGSSAINAPHVLIYNTEDTGHTGTTYGKVGQVQFNTTGIVTLGPQSTGLYSGLTIFQARSLILTKNGATTNNDDCNAKSGKPSEWDIAFQSMGNPGGANGALGGISGTVYAPGQSTSGTPPSGTGADFGLEVGGTTTLAVFTSCIFIDAADDVFNYSSDPTQLFGFGPTLSG